MRSRSREKALLEEDCWADGRYGNYSDSRVMLNDSRMIQELREGNIIGKYQLLNAMQKLADSDAARLKKNLLRDKSSLDFFISRYYQYHGMINFKLIT